MANVQNLWSHYENKVEEGMAICKICKKKLRNNRISNLKAHLTNVHKVNLSGASVQRLESSTSLSLEASGKILKKRKIEIEVDKTKFLRSYIGLVTEEYIPFNALNSKNMRKIIDAICDGLREADGRKLTLNASSCKKTLELVANNVKMDIADKVKNKFLSLKIGRDTMMTRSMFGISAQYIESSQIKSVLLGMVELKEAGSSTSKNLVSEIMKVLSKLNINLKQVVSITYDNESNVMKANILPFVCEEPEAEDEGYPNTEYIRLIDMISHFSPLQVGNIEVCQCAAHTTQLIALDVIKSADIIKHLMNCRNLTKYIRKTTNGFRQKFETKKLSLPQLDCPTRWGSTYKMLQDLLAAKDVLAKIRSIRNKTDEENFEVNATFWEFVDSYCHVCSPLHKAIMKFQEEDLHYGHFYAQWLKLKICTTKITKETTNELTKTIGERILAALETRTKKLVESKFLMSCLYLHPSFQHILTGQQKTDAVQHLKQIWDRLIEVDPAAGTNMAPHTYKYEADDVILEEEELLLIEYLAQVSAQNEETSTYDVYNKIERLKLPFERSDLDVLAYWQGRKHSDPELFEISNICYAVPPTQVSMECVFSTLRPVLTHYRNTLSAELIQDILLVKLNPTFLDYAIESLPLFEDEINGSDD